jgi:hypothetical protein
LSPQSAFVVVVVVGGLGSKHKHFLQYFLLTDDPQQSPPSQAQVFRLFSSSQLPSPLYFLLPQLGRFVVVVVVVVGGT